MNNFQRYNSPVPIRASLLLSLLSVLFVAGCHRDIAGVGPGDTYVASARWVDVEPGGSKSGIKVAPAAIMSETIIDFALPYAGFVSLSVCDGLDVPVVQLIDNRHLSAGIYAVQFTATDLASGVYIFKLVVRGVSAQGTASGVVYSDARKMMLLK